ncbi:hypothetical protein NYZ39_11275, partial [Acinetobacter baumannii]|nr:hypothetical protein [Acinetobacter baumannii]
PIGCTVDFRCRLIHLKIILWNKPLEIGLCNKANQHAKNKFLLTYLNSDFLSSHLRLNLLVAVRFPDETQDTTQLVSLYF